MSWPVALGPIAWPDGASGIARFAPGRLACLAGGAQGWASAWLDWLGGAPAPAGAHLAHGGLDVTALDAQARAQWRRRHVARLEAGLLERLTLAEHLPLVAALRADPAARRHGGVWLDRLGLADRLDARPHQLSPLDRARAALALALAGRPTLLLADQPTAGLPARAAWTFAWLLAQVAEASGAAVVAAGTCPALLAAADDRIPAPATAPAAGDAQPAQAARSPLVSAAGAGFLSSGHPFC